MVIVKIKKLFLPCMFGAVGKATVEFHAFDKHGESIANKSVTGKIGTPDQPGEHSLRLCQRAHDVRCDIPAGVICEWQVFVL